MSTYRPRLTSFWMLSDEYVPELFFDLVQDLETDMSPTD